jgi:hypothetical protein
MTRRRWAEIFLLLLALTFCSFARADGAQSVGGPNQCQVFGVSPTSMPSGSACQVGDDSDPFAPEPDPGIEPGNQLLLCEHQTVIIVHFDATLGRSNPYSITILVIQQTCRVPEGSVVP